MLRWLHRGLAYPRYRNFLTYFIGVLKIFGPKSLLRMKRLTHFWSILLFYTPWKRQKTFCFLCFYGAWDWNIAWKWVRHNAYFSDIWLVFTSIFDNLVLHLVLRLKFIVCFWLRFEIQWWIDRFSKLFKLGKLALLIVMV